ncbi:helix-turn-helix domain-containing protein, partial [Streptomyces sp. NPDC006129]|uniref:helix-turn-helix domain-containing protein n=1 Tax=Streptomyces sp. NPDC006129 TaxID=3155348 RepID=UPI0033AE546F
MEPETFPEELADALVGVQRLVRRRLRREMPDPRLRGAEAELLRLVVTRPGIGISDAARELGLAANSVSTLVNQLAGAGYLARETDPAVALGDGSLGIGDYFSRPVVYEIMAASSTRFPC